MVLALISSKGLSFLEEPSTYSWTAHCCFSS